MILIRFKFWLFGGTKELQKARNGKAIAGEFFSWLERWPLQRFWEAGNTQNDDEDCPYSYFRSRAVEKLVNLIEKDKSSIVISPPLWKRLYNRYLWRARSSSWGKGDMEPEQQSQPGSGSID